MFLIRALGLMAPGTSYFPGSGFLMSGTWNRSTFDLKATRDGSKCFRTGSITPNLTGLYSPGPGMTFLPESNSSSGFLDEFKKLDEPAAWNTFCLMKCYGVVYMYEPGPRFT